MDKWPPLSVPRTKIEHLHNVLCLCLLIISVIYLLFQWSNLPQTIPIHFNARGEADNWGSKSFLLFAPILSLLLFLGLTFLSKFPDRFNYPIKITEQNAAEQYAAARSLLSWIKLETIILFCYIEWSIVQNAKGHDSGLGIWALPVVLVVIFGTIIIYIIKMRNNK